MKKVLIALAILMVTGTLKAQEKRVITVPRPQVKELPKGFGVPVQRPQGFGKQQWQQPQRQIDAVERLKVQQRHQFGFGGYNYYRPVNPHFRYYRVPSYYPPVIIQPHIIVQPQPFPVYPMPFGGFYFQFRF